MNTQSTSYIIGLEGCGQYFKMSLRNLGLKDDPVIQRDHSSSVLDFVYKQCAEQVLIAYEGDERQFLQRLLKLPDLKFFEHIPEFSNAEWVNMFSQCFREFALNLLFRVKRVLGVRVNVDYLLEQIADDFIILHQYEKRFNL